MTPADPQIRVLLVGAPSGEGNRLGTILRRDGDIVVSGEASTGAEAVEAVARTTPDVVLLDLYLKDGGSRHSIEQIMARNPTPILVLAPVTMARDSRDVMEALLAGAMDVLPRPEGWIAEPAANLRRAIRQLNKIPVIKHPRGILETTTTFDPRSLPDRRPLVAIAASTGGPTALATLLAGLAGLPATVLVVQHLHADFTDRLAAWMSRISPLPVSVAEHHQIALAAHVYLAPGNAHLRVGPGFRLELDPEPASAHRPSADQLFLSVADRARTDSIGVLLTGIGDDGARGLLAIRERGGQTLAQNEASCAVFGMPQAAQRLGAVTNLLPVTELAGAIRRAVCKVRT